MNEENIEVSQDWLNQHDFLLSFYFIVWNQKIISTDQVFEWTKLAEKDSGYNSNGEEIFEFKKPKLPFISCLIGLKLGLPFKPATIMFYEIPERSMTMKELWKWCKE